MTDTKNFFKNHFMIIIFVIVTVSLLTQLFNYLFLPTIETNNQFEAIINQINAQKTDAASLDNIMQTISQLPDIEKQQFTSYLLNYVFKICLVLFINNIITLSCIGSLIRILSVNQFCGSNLFVNSLRLIPQIAIFIICAIPYFMLLSSILLIIKPLAPILFLLAIVIYMLTYVVFTAVIIDARSSGKFLASLKNTLLFIKQQTQLILMIFLFWLLATMALNTFFNLMGNSMIVIFFNTIAENLLVFTSLCCIYRLYLLTQQVSPYDTRH